MKNKIILRIAALILCLICAAGSLTSCGFFVETFLSEYTGVRTSAWTEYPSPTYPDEETTASPETTEESLEVTAGVPETTASPVTEAETTSVPETTKAPETTKKPETTKAPETTKKPETTKAPAVTEPAPSLEYADHVYLIAKDSGNCDELVGRVNVHVFFVNDTVSSWDQSKKSELERSFAEQERSLEADAKGYGKSLDITFTYTSVNISVPVDTASTDDAWQEAALMALGLKNLASAQTMLNTIYGGDSNPIVFAINKAGRAYASWSTGVKSERVTLFSSDYTSLRHELCHLYGARDFYYPAEAKELANTYIPDSLMSGGVSVDALTAYLIGWDEELDSGARKFLEATKHYTREYLDAEQDKQSVTGNVTNYVLSYGVYTGYLERGIPNGVGKIVYTSGDVYEGNFFNGDRHGKGKYTWTNGNVYDGDWVLSVRTGKGVLIWADSGNIYDGDWLDGQRTGKGTFTWSDGAVYIGDYVNGYRHGKGKYIWTDGSVYEGDFVENERTGKGTMTYSGGNVYTGDWLNGKCHGEGTMRYSSGSVYVGAWQSGNRTGYGRMDWYDGSSYEGEWLENKRHGYGKYINQYGQVYEGMWSNDSFLG